MASEKMVWRPIDTAEKKDGKCFLLSDGQQVVVGWWMEWGGQTHGGFWEVAGDFREAHPDFEPTYWMPFPDPPTRQPEAV